MLRGIRAVIIVATLTSFLPRPAHGQAAAINGEINGAVTDVSGAAVARAVIEIVSLETGFKQSVMTTESGLYRFRLLPLGTYDLKTQAAGFTDARRTGIVVNAGATVTVSVSLEVAGEHAGRGYRCRRQR